MIEPIKIDKHFLWHDGSISVDPDLIIDYVYKLSSRNVDLSKLYVTSKTKDIDNYNLFADNKLTIKTDCQLDVPFKWNIPDKYKYLDIDKYLIDLITIIEKDDLYNKRIERLAYEIYLFKKLNLCDIIKTLIYIIDVMKEKKVIWGVGRGSSCSSYLLYLIGLHEVDTVKFDIDIEDFLKIK